MKKPRAASLIYALIITTIVLVVAGGMAASFMRASQRNYDLFRGTQAYYASRAAMEMAFAEVSDPSNGIGYEYADSSAVSWDVTGTADVVGEYEFWSRAKTLGWQDSGTTNCYTVGVYPCYIVPIPGTGDAGSCDFEEPDGDWNTDEDAECNWNKIAYGETITVPLYTSDDSSPFTGGEEFILRLRTPDGATLNNDSEEVASWEFTGTCGGVTCYLRPNSSSFQHYIYPDNINSATSYIVMQATDVWGLTLIKEGVISGTKTIMSIQDFLSDATGDEFYFKLTIIKPLEEYITGYNIPYLEYQVITDSEIISDSKIVYTASGSAEGRLGVYTRDIQATQGLGSNSVINFALQN